MFAKRMASSDMGCAIKFHKTVKALPCLCYTKIKHSALGLDGNKALGFASCFITISAMRLKLYFSYSTHGNALTYTYSMYT